MEQTDRAQSVTGLYPGYESVYAGISPSRAGSTVALKTNAVPPATGAPSFFSDIHDEAEVGRNDAVAAPGPAETSPGNVPPAKIPLWKRRWFIITSIIGACVGIALLFIVLFPVVRAIAQHIVNVSVLNIDKAAIINPQNGSFSLEMDGWVSHAGIFGAKIDFLQPINVAWEEPGIKNPTPLGAFSLQELTVKNKRAYVNQTVQFTITDQKAFGRFTTAMITSQNFTWLLTSQNVRVAALKFPVAHGLSFKKYVTLNGINNFNGNVLLKDFQLPSDASGGINFVAVTELDNTSPFQLALGTIVFDLFYQDMYLGTGSAPGVELTTSTNDITLKGVLVKQYGSQNLTLLSQLFTNYLNHELSPVKAIGRSAILASDGSTISWLSDGLKSLTLNIPFQSPEPINPIRSIGIISLSLDFNATNPWAPLATSRHVNAELVLPFGFDLSIGQIQNTFNITSFDGKVASGLSTPLGASTSNISVFSSTDTEGNIDIEIKDTYLAIPEESHPIFSQFTANITQGTTPQFLLVGQSHAVANLSVGQITLDPIKFNVTSSLDGLRGLNGYVNITGVDVVGGTANGLELAINVTIDNPSNLNISVGDLNLQLYRNSSMIGTALMPNLTLNMGNNFIHAQSTFDANSSPEGLETLDKFVASEDVLLRIAGYNQSTNISSLSQAFSLLDINATLPGLKSKLLESASLVVLNSTGHLNNITHVSVSLANPFAADLSISQVNSNVSYLGIHLGSITSSDLWKATGKSATNSPQFNMDMNMDPPSLFTVLRALAVSAGLPTAQLDGIVALGGYQYVQTSNSSSSVAKRDITSRANIYTGFDLVSYVDTAFKKLQSDVALETVVTIGSYQTTLQYTQTAVPTKTDNSLNLLLPLLAGPIVQKIVDGSILSIDNLTITNPAQTSFGVQLHGGIANAGPFDATISFGGGLDIVWNAQKLGSMKMPDVKLTGDVGATLNLDATFEVASTTVLTAFTKVLLTQPSFDWEISAQNLTVSALGISVPQISLNTKKVTLKGMNNLQNSVVINSFDLPSNDPAGGITLTINSTVTNPSQVGIALSSLGFQAFFGQTNLGPVGAGKPFTLAPLSAINLPLSGRLVKQNSNQGLADVSAVFNNFIHGKNSNVTVQGDSAGDSSVTWLNEGIKSLVVATVLPNQGVLNIIKSITLSELSLMFTQPTEWDPATSTVATTAAFQIPFGFPVDIVSMDENIGVSLNGDIFALLSVPHGSVQTDVRDRIIHLTFNDVPFAAYGDKHAVFQDFLASTTLSKSQTMGLTGSANADASTAVGVISLTDIAFDVQSTLAGLQGLNTIPTIVSNLDVNHGFPDYLLINVDTSLLNPSNLTIGTGDVAFDLQFESSNIGTAVIPNMVIKPGNNSYAVGVHYSPQGGAVPSGQHMLANFLQGVTSATTIAGSQDSTNISSLTTALSQIVLSPVNIPPLHQNLITSTSLVFPTDIVKTGIASVSFDLTNPFTASINLLTMSATAVFENFILGKINNVDRTSNPIHADGHSSIKSDTLPFEFNLDPLNLIGLLLTLSKEKNINFGPLPQLFNIVLQNPLQHGNITTSVDTNKPTCVSGNQFDVNGAVLAALKGLQVTLGIQTSVKLDDYATDLVFNQSHVPAITDSTALFLIGAVSAPIAQALVSQAQLTFTQAKITNVANDGFDLALQGSLTGTGPLDAMISFVEPVTVTWQGQDIATIALPDVCAAANIGVPKYQTNGHLTITNQNGFTQFAIFLLHNPSFDWTISTSKLRVTALGTIFDNVQLTKTITLKALNGLPGVKISNFKLPSDDPNGGIHIETDSQIPSPSQLGIDLGTVGFQAFFNGVQVGPLSGNNLFLAPNAVTPLHLSGRITPKSGNDLNTMGTLFTNYLQGQSQTLSVQGDFVQPTGSSGTVQWLSTAFKTLTLQVTLPGQKFQIIQSIALNDFGVKMVSSDEDFAPLASSSNTVAVYKNPFGFSLQVVESAEHITLTNSNGAFATLEIAKVSVNGGVSTGNDANLPLQFQDQPLKSTNNAGFQQLFQQVTDTKSATFGLAGSADVTARTSIGDVPIANIPFDVSTTLGGINAFGGSAILSNVAIAGSGGNGGNQYVNAPLQTTLQNPSSVSLETVDIALPVEYKGVMIGRAVINPFNLVPGTNVVATEFHYEPQNANDTTAQDFISAYLQSGADIPLTIKGDAASTPFQSLQPALEGLSLSTSVKGLNANPILVHINANIPLSSIATGMISIDFDVHNPLDTDLTILMVQADGKVGGTTYAHFDQSFGSFVIPPHQTANSGTVNNVFLPKGALGSLGILPLGELDVFISVSAQVGSGGYVIPWLQLTQLKTPTHYSVNL